jgi:diadenosine tetraphosphatase ApaH/serine/threonine PP2A family protein phosphatase
MLPAATFGYGACGNEAIIQIRQLDYRGHHKQAEKYLDGLLLVHATPRDPARWDYIFSQKEAQRHFEVMEEPVAFIGHSHIPAEFRDETTGKRIINIGSVGQPRDGDARLSCGLFETEAGTFQWIREVYPVQDAAAKIRRAGLPEFLAQRLLLGM